MTEKVLLHVCCGPCALYPVAALRREGFDLTGFFFNPNIHPYLEHQRRAQTLEQAADKLGLRMLPPEPYQIQDWLRAVCFREQKRCEICYSLRLSETARRARQGKFDYFSTTILYSKFQKHELARELAEAAAQEHQVKFLYRDFREGWKPGIELSLELGLYRQKYCGCVYSEQERFARAGLKSKERAGGTCRV